MQGISNIRSSSLHTSFICREAISQNESTYVACLDVRKAFDTVWVTGLLYKLIQLEVDSLLWLIIKNSFHEFKCLVRINGKQSGPFYPKQGVHQGDIFSMFLYCIYNNDLLKKLNQFSMQVNINYINCTSPAFVDDVTLIATSQAALQNLIDAALEHSKVWHYSYNINKCKILVFGKTLKNLVFYMNGVRLDTVASHNHLGIPLCTKPKAEKVAVNERISAHQVSVSAINSIGISTGGTNPICASKLYWAITIPKFIYGLEIWGISPENLNLMENAHERCCSPLSGPTTSISWYCSKSHLGLAGP